MATFGLIFLIIGIVISGSNSYDSQWRFERQTKSFEFTGSVFVTSVVNSCLCITRDTSGGNQGLRMYLEDYCAIRKVSRYAKNYTPKLEIAKISESDDYQLSQAHREKGKPYGLAGCLTPDDSGILGSDCKSNNSLWNFVYLTSDRIQLVHRNTGKCVRGNDGRNSIVLARCDKNDADQQWTIKIEKD